jgi:hypothetical protein
MQEVIEAAFRFYAHNNYQFKIGGIIFGRDVRNTDGVLKQAAASYFKPALHHSPKKWTSAISGEIILPILNSFNCAQIATLCRILIYNAYTCSENQNMV